MKKEKKKNRSVALPEWLWDKLKAKAEKERRSINQVIEIMITDNIDKK